MKTKNTLFPNFKKHAFTLVELIIVITILAILATIAFVSFQNYSKDSRDGNRLATITQIEKWLLLLEVQSGKYPMPEGNIYTGTIKINEDEISYSYIWVIGKNISTMIKMNTTPLDPDESHHYVYAVNTVKNKYQIATILENLQVNQWNPFIEKAFAGQNQRAKVVWNHDVNVKISSGEDIYLTTTPSMIYAGTNNILNSSGSYQVVNGWENLPYKRTPHTQTTKETGNVVMQKIRKNNSAQIVTLNITNIINAKTPEERKEEIETLFWTWWENEILPWITSKSLLATVWVPTEEMGKSKEIENIIFQWPVVTYSPPMNNEEIKDCSGKPANSKYYGGSETYQVTITKGSAIPSSTYNDHPQSNTCEFSCELWFTHQSGQCNDITPPSWESFTINTGDENTHDTNVTLNITCPSDVSSPIEVAYGTTTTPINWTSCQNSLWYTLTSGNGVKTVYVRFRDSIGNTTTSINDTIELINTWSLVWTSQRCCTNWNLTNGTYVIWWVDTLQKCLDWTSTNEPANKWVSRAWAPYHQCVRCIVPDFNHSGCSYAYTNYSK